MAISSNNRPTDSIIVSKFKASGISILRGAGQVMFQQSAWTGILFIAGIFYGSYVCHLPQVAWGAVVGLVSSTITGLLIDRPLSDGKAGLWGFNGILVGCAFPTFLANTWLMWAALVFCSAVTPFIRRGFNNVMDTWGVTSYTFPFVFLTWLFLLASRQLGGMPQETLSHPELMQAASGHISIDCISLTEYWLNGISQVFLVKSWVTGILFLIGLWLCSRWAAVWAAIGSALALGLAILFKADPIQIVDGLYGFSPVLTAIAVGCTFYKVNWRSALWAIIAIAATFFIQVGMDAFMLPWGVPTLTGPFCLTTWLFMLPAYKFNN